MATRGTFERSSCGCCSTAALDLSVVLFVLVLEVLNDLK